METVQRLRERFPKLQDPPSDDICYATQNRQVAVKAMAPECELVIVVGSRNSSNSVRLVEVALGAGSDASYLVDYAEDIDPAWLDGVTTVGVTSGASVPEVLVRGVLERLADYGYDMVQPVTTANETLVFALPARDPARAQQLAHSRQTSYSQESASGFARAAAVECGARYVTHRRRPRDSAPGTPGDASRRHCSSSEVRTDRRASYARVPLPGDDVPAFGAGSLWRSGVRARRGVDRRQVAARFAWRRAARVRLRPSEGGSAGGTTGGPGRRRGRSGRRLDDLGLRRTRMA